MPQILTEPGIIDRDLLLLLMARSLPKPGPVEVKIPILSHGQRAVSLHGHRLIVFIGHEVDILLVDQRVLSIARRLIPLIFRRLFR